MDVVVAECAAVLKLLARKDQPLLIRRDTLMKADDAKFKAGDILKAAGWAAPARNKARGNVFNDLTWVNWTGPAYL